MTTNDNFLNITSKRILGVDDFGDRFFNYLRDTVLGLSSKMFGLDMVFSTSLTLGGDTDAVTISGTSIAADASGHLLDVANAYQGTSAAFENANTVDYYVGLHYCEVPQSVQVNPRTGLPEYAEYIEEVGLSGTPTSVTDNGNDTITFNVNSILESGVDHKNRYVTVYKLSPGSTAITDAIAIETIQVSYSSPNNTITTAGTLGQATVSTTASDYVVVLRGPVISKNTDLESEDGYVFLGTVTGSGAGTTPTVFDTTNQRVLPTSWANSVYEGFDSDLYPATDSTYDLGKSDKKWANIYTDNLSISSDLLPVNDGTQNLGSGTKRWNNLYMDGLVNNHLIPQGSAIYDLGQSGNNWGDLYLSRLHLTSFIYGDLIPATDNNYDLGDGTHAWKDVYIAGAIYGDLIPATTDTYDLGSSSAVWAEIHCTTLNATNVGGNLIPDGAHDLGDNSNEWSTIYVTNTRTDSIVGESSTTVEFGSVLFKPSSPAGADLGNATDYWDDVYSSAVRTNFLFGLSGGNIALTADIYLQDDNTYSMANSTNAFSEIHSHILSCETLRSDFGTFISVTDNFKPSASVTYDLGANDALWANAYVSRLRATDIYVNSGDDLAVNANIIPTTSTDTVGTSANPWADMYAKEFTSVYTDNYGANWITKTVSAADMVYKESTTISQNDLYITNNAIGRELKASNANSLYFNFFIDYDHIAFDDTDAVIEIWWLAADTAGSKTMSFELDLTLQGEHYSIPTNSVKTVTHNTSTYFGDDMHKTVFRWSVTPPPGYGNTPPFIAHVKLERDDAQTTDVYVTHAVFRYRAYNSARLFNGYPTEG